MSNEKVVILAGGFGTRLSEYTESIPKPMVKIGGKPILWHIMKIYSSYGYNDFIICLGHKGHLIKDYFVNNFTYDCDFTLDYVNNTTKYHNAPKESWKITLVDTGETTMTGGRIKKIQKYIDGRFFLTYGDGVADINIPQLLKHHNNIGKMTTVTAVQPSGRFGGLEIENESLVKSFIEKKRSDSPWINGGFFVCEPEIFNYIKGDKTIFESDVLEQVAQEQKLACYKHTKFWECMDTKKEYTHLNKLWNNNKANWKLW